MFNVARHAAAHRAWIELGYGPGVARLVVADDGLGDAVAVRRILDEARTSRRGRHRGLVNVHERVDELKGTVNVLARRGGGIRVRVTVPLPSAEADRGAER
jgi:signal transduction histidine kinase